MVRIFISYDRESKDRIQELIRDLDELGQGHESWYDQKLKGGQQWWDHILEQIRMCDVLLAVLTKKYLDSKPCRAEYGYAAALNKIILPIRLLDDVTANILPPILRERNWIDYSYNNGFRQLYATFRSIGAAPPLPDILPPPPLAPISAINLLREKIEREQTLTFSDQCRIVVELGATLRDGEAPEVVLDLVYRLKRREDTVLRVGAEIDQLLREIEGANAGPIIQKREVAENLEEKREYASKQGPLPGSSAKRFTALTRSIGDEILIRPSAYPLTPMYLLDDDFRIIDWNQAFSVAFDRTMEGRKGSSVLEWTYFLDNYEEVLAHGQEKFGNKNSLPAIDVESIEYTSFRYGAFTATKRAYQVPDDEENCIGWLITLDLHFPEQQTNADFRRDLLGVLSRDLMWSEYAISYDRVLNNTDVYPALLERFVTGMDGKGSIAPDAKIIDLGAGTGNLTYKLISTGPRRLVCAAENNRVMLELLKEKCKKYISSSSDSGGVIALKQDITSLYGLDPAFFDYAFMNNVLYAIDDVDACLREVFRVLKSGGELRLSGPRENTSLDILFEEIMKELKQKGKFEALEIDYYHVKRLNELRLSEMLYRWTTPELKVILRNVGFIDVASSEDVYCGQSMFVCAKKP